MQDELQGFRVQGDDQIDFALSVTQKQQLGQMLPVLRTGVARQIQIFEELLFDAQPTGFQGRHESLVGLDVDGHVGFEGMQDEDVFPGQRRWWLVLGRERKGGKSPAKDNKNDKNQKAER